jgi:hypothetical protein
MIKLLAPLQRFTIWLFDVEQHPLQAVGIVSAFLVIVVSFLATVISRL